MRTSKNIPFSLVIFLVLSGILHAAAIFSVSGAGMLGIAGVISEKSLSADLVHEGPARLHAKRMSERYPGVYSSSGAFSGGSVTPEEKNKEGAVATNGPPAAFDGHYEDMQIVENKATASEDVVGEGIEDAVKVAKYIAPEEALISPKLSQFPRILNFKREKFSYDIFWLGIYVGKAVLTAVNEDGIVRITSQVHSAPVISAVYKVEDYAESRVKDGRPFNFRIRQHEGRYRSDKEIIFDAGGGKITYYDYLKGIKDEHLNSGSILWDVISGFYYLRTKGLDPDKTVYIDIFDSNKVLNAEVNVLGRDRIGLAGRGDVDTIIVKPILKSEGLFQNKGDIRVWLTNDENRMPVRVETKVSIGKVTAELKQVETEK